MAARLCTTLCGLGFTQQAAACIVDQQGFATPEDFATLTDNEVSDVCKVTRRPGGLDVNGDPNAGITVSIVAENDLKLFCFYSRHKQRTSRPLTVPNQGEVRERVRAFAALSNTKRTMRT